MENICRAGEVCALALSSSLKQWKLWEHSPCPQNSDVPKECHREASAKREKWGFDYLANRKKSCWNNIQQELLFVCFRHQPSNNWNYFRCYHGVLTWKLWLFGICKLHPICSFWPMFMLLVSVWLLSLLRSEPWPGSCLNRVFFICLSLIMGKKIKFYFSQTDILENIYLIYIFGRISLCRINAW